MKTLKVDFSLKDRVRVKDLGLSGQIIAIFVSKMGTEYKVRYYLDKEPKEYYFFAEDLSLLDSFEKEEIGFKTQ